MNSRTDRLLQGALLFSLGLMFVPILSDGFVLGDGGGLDLTSLKWPLILVNGLGFAYAWYKRKEMSAFARRFLRGRTSPDDERLASRTVWALVCFGFILRIARIGEAGLSPDESQFVWVASFETLADLLRFEVMASPHPPGNFIMLHWLMKISWHPFLLRLPAVLSGTYLIWISYRFGREMFRSTAGLALALLVCLSPAMVDLARTCRNYSPGFALFVTGLYFLARFLKDEDWRHYLGFAICMPLAVSWHYSFVSIWIGANLTGLLHFVRIRRDPAWWMRALGYQIPGGLLLAGLYFGHIRRIPAGLGKLHEYMLRDHLAIDVARGLEPLRGVWDYLVPGPLADPFFLLSLVAIPLLAIRRLGWQLGILTLPIAMAYVFMFMGKLPLGGTRHSSYLFPFLFGLLIALVPIWRSRIERKAEAPEDEAGSKSRLEREGWTGMALMVAAALLFVNLSLLDYDRRARTRYVAYATEWNRAEFPIHYRLRDIERGYEILEQEAGPNDIVLLTTQGRFAWHANRRVRPFIDADTPARLADLRWANSGEGALLYLEEGGLHFYSAPTGMMSRIPDVLQGYERVKRRFGLKNIETIWIIRGAWDWPFADALLEYQPGLEIDFRISDETHGWLFAIDATTLDGVSRRMRREGLIESRSRRSGAMTGK